MKSTTTYDTNYIDSNGDSFLFSNKIRVFRDGRRYDDVTFIKADNDGYANHIYNELTYTSKDINSHIGMLFNKNINVLINTGLTQVIGYIQSTMKGKCYLHKDKFKRVIIPELRQLQPAAPKPTVKLTIMNERPLPSLPAAAVVPSPQLIDHPIIEVVPISNIIVSTGREEVPDYVPLDTLPHGVLTEPVAIIETTRPDNITIEPVLKEQTVTNNATHEKNDSSKIHCNVELEDYLIKMIIPIVQNSSKESTTVLDFHLQCTSIFEELYNQFVK